MKLWVVLAFSKHLIGLVDDVSEISSAIHVLQFEDCNTFLLTKSAVPVRKRFVAAKSRSFPEDGEFALRSYFNRFWGRPIRIGFPPAVGHMAESQK